MNFVLFEDAEGNIINNITWVNEGLMIPNEAIAFTYFHQRDIDNIYMKKYRVGKKITTIGDLHNLDCNLVESAIHFAGANPSVNYSAYIENDITYFHILNENITLVKDKNELRESLLIEITKDLNVQSTNKAKR